MTPISRLLPASPGFTALSRTHAGWPVWSGSTTEPVPFPRTTRRQAYRLFNLACALDRTSHQKGKHGGRLGRETLAVFRVLIFDFLNYGTGRLDPSYAAIGRKAGWLSPRAVGTALKRLREMGLLHRIRRCRQELDERGAFRLRQETNAYVLLPTAHWRERPPVEQEPSAPLAGTWGDPARMPDALGAYAAESDPVAALRALRANATTLLEAALARMGGAIAARDSASS